jgi:CBS domain-containing protein
MKVSVLMTKKVKTVQPDASISTIAKLMRDEDIGAVPVANKDKLIGMVTDRDIVIRALASSQDPGSVTAQSIMSARVMYCFSDQDVEEVLSNMGDQQIRRLAVVDRDKRLVGVVSLGDLSGHASAARAANSLSDISRHDGASR